MNHCTLLAIPMIAFMTACTTTAQLDAEIPRLPEEAPKVAFTHKSESLLRGVRGSYNTVPAGRASAILDVTYTLECLSGGKPTARQNFAKAAKKLDNAYKIAPIYFDNPRERGSWNRSAKRLIIQDKTCQVTGVRDEVKTKDSRQVLLWVLQNKAFPQQ